MDAILDKVDPRWLLRLDIRAEAGTRRTGHDVNSWTNQETSSEVSNDLAQFAMQCVHPVRVSVTV
jgi:hypothetical protein